MESRPDVGAAGPDPERRRLGAGVDRPDLGVVSEWRQRRLVLGVAQREPGALAAAEALYAREHEPGWVSGSCLMARRAALEAVSGFDERFFLYEEDADLCLRLRKAGWRVVYTPAAEVRHQLGRSMSSVPRRARLEYHLSHLRYYGKQTAACARPPVACRPRAPGMAMRPVAGDEARLPKAAPGAWPLADRRAGAPSE
jgi:hypothetical protein